ncbi:hypothetical protein N7509_013839 [Penicillium cosmopolitanum]|uniref:Uncharacterized protein n=1 Tax=Penicillium cosmopolitanum TaxID=1131564 RepID=A0A9W9SE62_9EURO|nr:uncharacterized protein N7509_013839 [Penicillium cosmopolitanum]KAJ5376953.1 hypothetical protein N7509_013839 [Penicillium cosmopolitanum]
MIISGACTALVVLVMFSLMFWHAIHLSKPREQIKIMKICILLPLYTVTSFLSICFPRAYTFLAPWLEVFQAVALGSFFLLLCEFISKDSATEIDIFFVAFEAPQKKGKSHITGLEWFRKQWIAIFQYPIVALGVAITTDITQAAGIYCLESNEPYFAHLWLTIISIISVAFAVMSVLNFYRGLSQCLSGHKPLSKLLAFKLIVGLSFLERIIFAILRTANTLNPTAKLSYADVNIGIPNLIICLQMVPFALFFPYAYSVSPYLSVDSYHPYHGGFLGVNAWIGLFNPMEILRATAFAFGMAAELRKDGAIERAGDTGYYARQGHGGNPSLYVSPGQSHARGPAQEFQGAYVPLLDKDGRGTF